MFKSMEKNKLGVRILLGIIVGILAIGMLLYLVPGQGGANGSANDVVAEVGGQPVTGTQVRQQLAHIESSGQMQPALRPLYTQQIIQQLVFDKMMDIEARKLGVTVSETDVANRIKMILPTAFENGARWPLIIMPRKCRRASRWESRNLKSSSARVWFRKK